MQAHVFSRKDLVVSCPEKIGKTCRITRTDHKHRSEKWAAPPPAYSFWLKDDSAVAQTCIHVLFCCELRCGNNCLELLTLDLCCSALDVVVLFFCFTIPQNFSMHVFQSGNFELEFTSVCQLPALGSPQNMVHLSKDL